VSVDTKGDSKTEVEKQEMVTFTIDGIELEVPKGTLVIRAAEQTGIDIPRFCEHPLLDPVAACRQCIVDVPDGGNGKPMKPQPACALQAMPGMVVETADSNEKVAKHQAGMLEFLLLNHPLDCPICDKGGECPLQNQAMSHGRGESRYEGLKRTYPKPINLSAQILLDRERCVLCQRCTRFGTQISGDNFISLAERGGLSQIAIYETDPYQSYFSGNIIQICPVGALTSADYRFQARPFDLVSTQTTCESCAAGCELRTDHRHFQVKRRLAGNDPEVNEEWSCDKGRFAFYSGRLPDRLTHPLVRRDGELQPASWPEAIDVAVNGLRAAGENVGVITGGQLTLENAFAYSRFARTVLGTNNIDFRTRPYGAGESNFLAAQVAGKTLTQSVTYGDLERAKQVVLVGFEPEDESPIVFLRLRKAWRKSGLKVLTIAPLLSNGSTKMGAELVETIPGREVAALSEIAERIDAETIILAGERLSMVDGGLAKVVEVAEQRGARWAWIPRRAGELAAIEAGCLPNLLPGGRWMPDATARVDLQAAWGVDKLPTTPGLPTEQMLAAAADGRLKALVTAGFECRDLGDPDAAAAALTQAFVVSFEQRRSDVTELADVVFPVALLEEQDGTLINWEHRYRPVNQVNRNRAANAMTDVRALAALADALGFELGFRTPAQARAAFDEIADWTRTAANNVLHDADAEQPTPAVQHQPLRDDSVTLASWHYALDDSRVLDGALSLRATAPQPVIRVSPTTAVRFSLVDGDLAQVATQAGNYVAPLRVDGTMVDDVAWIPANTDGSAVAILKAHPGDRVQLSAVTAGGAA